MVVLPIISAEWYIYYKNNNKWIMTIFYLISRVILINGSKPVEFDEWNYLKGLIDWICKKKLEKFLFSVISIINQY